MKIIIGSDNSTAYIALESPEDIKRMQRIFALGINCQSDRGKDVELVADTLLDAVTENRVAA